ncbi:MAG: hypothetical protein ACE5KG_02170 [Nitrososphaerales archaeon]
MTQQLNLPYLSDQRQKLSEKINTSLPGNMDELRGQPILVGREMGNTPLGRWSASSSNGTHAIPLIQEERIIVSIDSSALPVAQLEEGYVVASRLSIVFSLFGAPKRFIRIGPLLHFLKARQIVTLREPKNEGQDPSAYGKFLRCNLEQLAAQLVSRMDDTCILLDGSLAYWDWQTYEAPHSTYVAISKSIPFRDQKSYSHPLGEGEFRCSYTSTRSMIKESYETLYVRFGKSPFILRVDVATQDHDTWYPLGLIKKNDTLSNGYPESLRLAHHFSIFTQMEIESLRYQVLTQYDPIENPSYNLRKAILGNAYFRGNRRI